MEITLNIRCIALAAVLALSAGAARAGSSVTYNFIEGPHGPNPGTVGGILTFASPPASDTAGWSTDSLADVLSFQITDPALGSGFYTPTDITTVVSTTGAALNSGSVKDLGMGGHVNAAAFFGDGPVGGFLEARSYTTGAWVAASSVPEPSSLVMAGIASTAGLGLWARRRTAGRTARRSP